MKALYVTLFLVISPMPEICAQATILDAYISKALEQNAGYKQEKLNFEIQQWNVKEARGNFYPSLSFNARYTVANGGRTIDFPIGDLLHPVYNSLNQLTSSDQFSPLIANTSNQAFQFYRPQEHETKLHLVQPIYNRNIKLNYEAKQQLLKAQKHTLETEKLALILEVKTSYYEHLQALEILLLMREIEKVHAENVRVTKSLFDNQKVTIDNVYSAQAEQARHDKEIALARKNVNLSRSYFNFLIGAPLTSTIESTETFKPAGEKAEIDTLEQWAMESRPELKALDVYKAVKDIEISSFKANNMPTVSAVIDYGFQGETYAFNNEQDFVLASLVLQWEFFKGFTNKSRIKKALLGKQQIELQKNELQEQINLQIIQAYYEVEAAQEAWNASLKEAKAKALAYDVVLRKYREGQASQLALLSAQSGYTAAQQEKIISQYQVLIAIAALEKAAGIMDQFE